MLTWAGAALNTLIVGADMEKRAQAQMLHGDIHDELVAQGETSALVANISLTTLPVAAGWNLYWGFQPIGGTAMKKSALSIGFALWSGCFFMPNVDESGYTDCDTTNDCDVGRYCASNYCVPPPWHDESYNQRRLLVLENQREAKLYKGNAISFWVGESGTTLSLEDVTSDTRYLYFDIEAQRWDILPVYFDVFDDRYAVWLPISEDVAAGGRAPLVWMENLAGDSDKGPNVSPSQVFAMYYNFGVTESCQSPWLCFGTGTPVLTEGVVRVEDNQMMLLDQPLTLPFDISFKLRINGANCENVFGASKHRATRVSSLPCWVSA